MIVSIHRDNSFGENEGVFTTQGCGCCSETLYLSSNREYIIEHLLKNVEVIKDSCKILGIDFNEFIKTF